jgi:hypothetical protein
LQFARRIVIAEYQNIVYQEVRGLVDFLVPRSSFSLCFDPNFGISILRLWLATAVPSDAAGDASGRILGLQIGRGHQHRRVLCHRRIPVQAFFAALQDPNVT